MEIKFIHVLHVSKASTSTNIIKTLKISHYAFSIAKLQIIQLSTIQKQCNASTLDFIAWLETIQMVAKSLILKIVRAYQMFQQILFRKCN